MGGIAGTSNTRGTALPEPTPLAHLFLLDDGGRFLCGFDRDFAREAESDLPAALLSQARRVGAEGLLPPRATLTIRAGRFFLLSILGDLVYLHVAFLDETGEDDARRALSALLAFESTFKAHLFPFRGDPSRFLTAAGVVRQAFAAPPGTLRPPLPPEVFLHPILGAKGARLTVELRLRNLTHSAVFGVTVPFSSPGDFLRPVALFGKGATLLGSEIHLLHPLEPGLNVLLLHLEPQEPRTGPFLAALRFADAHGADRTVPARQLRIAIAVPPLSAARPKSTRELQASLERGDLLRDAWRFRYPAIVSPAFAFARAKEAVERERPLKVLEFSNADPLYYEAWYLAEVRRTGRPVVVETSVWGGSRLLDLRVATERQAELIGALAEYRRRVRELLSERFMGRRPPVAARSLPPARDEAPSPELHSPLLMRHLQGDLPASDLSLALRRAQEWDRGLDIDLVAEFEEVMGQPESEPRPSPAAPRPPRAPRLAERTAEFELVPGLLEVYRKLVAPVVRSRAVALAETRLRRRPDRDSSVDSEIEEFEVAD